LAYEAEGEVNEDRMRYEEYENRKKNKEIYGALGADFEVFKFRGQSLLVGQTFMTYQEGDKIFIHGNSSALWYDVEKETFKDSGLTLKNNYLGYEHLTSAIKRDKRHIYFMGSSFVNIVDF
jgi:hypothetical protein